MHTKFISSGAFAFVVAAGITGPIGSAAFAPPCPKLSPRSTYQGWDVRSRFQDLHPSVFKDTSSRHFKGVRPLGATAPDYSSLSNYADSLLDPSRQNYEISWVLGLLFTIVLFYGIFTTEKEDKNIHGGFCVTCFNDEGYYIEDDFIGGFDVKESHQLSGIIDAILLVIAVLIPVYGARASIPPLFGIPYNPEASFGTAVSAVALIGVHGYLHYFNLSRFYEGYVTGKKPLPFPGLPNDEGNESGDVLFAILSFVIAAASITGYSSIPENFGPLVEGGVIFVLGGLTYLLTKAATERGYNPISVFFGITQLLVTGVATFVPDDLAADALMGWTFAFTCFVALLEFYLCEQTIRKIGGHAWYDLSLHIAVLTGFWVFTEDHVDKAFRALSSF